MQPIPKSKDSKHINEFRPISLTSLLRRCFESRLLRYLKVSESTKHIFEFNKGQGGFRSGYSTLSQVLLAEEGTNLGLDIKVFLDLQQAYDRVPHKRLFRALKAIKMPYTIAKLLYSLFVGCIIHVTVNKQLTRYIKIDRGLFQGSLLSPLLFNIFIDSLAKIINLTW